MFEFGVTNHQSIESFAGSKKGVGSKPIILFSGDIWQRDSLYSSIQNLILDLFRGDRADKVSLQGLDHVLFCSFVSGHICIRAYMCNFKKEEGSKVKFKSILKHMKLFLLIIIIIIIINYYYYLLFFYLLSLYFLL